MESDPEGSVCRKVSGSISNVCHEHTGGLVVCVATRQEDKIIDYIRTMLI